MNRRPLPDATSPSTTVASGSPIIPTHGNETEFTDAVVEIAHLYGWKAAHFRPARTTHGWRTAVQYDAKGFVDLVLVQPVRGLLWHREIKVRGSKGLDADQQNWRDWLIAAGANYDIWRPDDWPDIIAALSNGTARVA